MIQGKGKKKVLKNLLRQADATGRNWLQEGKKGKKTIEEKNEKKREQTECWEAKCVGWVSQV